MLLITGSRIVRLYTVLGWCSGKVARHLLTGGGHRIDTQELHCAICSFLADHPLALFSGTTCTPRLAVH